MPNDAMPGNAKAAILYPPLTFLNDAPFLTMSAGILEKKVLLTYPMSLYTRADSGKIEWLGFLYVFLFTAKNQKKVAQVTYPLCFDRAHEKEIYERLLKEAEELARAFGASQLQYEGHLHLTKELFKPYSTVVFGNVLNPSFLALLREKGFTQEGVTSCYEVEGALEPGGGRLTTYTISDFNARRSRYLHFCETSSSFLQAFERLSVEQLPMSATERGYFREEWVLFLGSEGREVGCVRWFPQSVFTGEMRGEAKIVRLLFGDVASEVMVEGVREALRQIGSQGMKKIQVADVAAGSPIESYLKGVGDKVGETMLMVEHL